MSLKKPANVIVFAIVLGLIAYLASAFWSAIFIVSLPMAEDAVVDAIEIQTGEDDYEWRPVEFKNSLEELKYYLILSRDLEYIANAEQLMADAETVSRMLHGLIRSISKR